MSHSLPWNKTNTKILSKDAFKTTNHVLIGLKISTFSDITNDEGLISRVFSPVLNPGHWVCHSNGSENNEHINTTRLPLIRVKEMQWTHWPAVLRSRFTVDLWPDLYAWHLGGCDPGDAAVVLQRPVSVMCAYVYRFECVCVCVMRVANVLTEVFSAPEAFFYLCSTCSSFISTDIYAFLPKSFKVYSGVSLWWCFKIW